ncbi:sulfotransferase [Aquisalimonas sp. 2447]|uniref:sulfotransferase family protein n=1 Tax=Aquisalimonas sp. 2447 TaxID=2740807 RepID=UPI0020C52286|nr:sulfotransferase [Aquisalimonas sp. 2447]
MALNTSSNNNRSRPPVIVIGMHRAGTSMLTRILQGFGFFMGRNTTRNEECRWMNALNYWVFDQASATWERPSGVDTILTDQRIRQLAVDYLGGITDGPASIGYLGWTRWLRHRSMHHQPHAWGWKDPRNTYTLPLWLEIFPNARVLHITRHGVDVAESLRVRHRTALNAAADRYRRRRWLYVNNPLAPKRSGFAHAASVDDLGYGLDLWKAYTERARAHTRSLGDGALELRYEDLLSNPEHHLGNIVQFCELRADHSEIRRQAEYFRPNRMFAYQHDPELIDFADSRRETLEALGYNARN